MILDLDLIFASKIIATMEPKKPQSLLKKYFQLWWKMSKLIYEIFILDRQCSEYPDLKKYRGQPELKRIIYGYREELKESKRQLKELI